MAVCTLDTNRKAGTSTVSGIGSRKRNVDDRHHKGVKIGLTLSAFWTVSPNLISPSSLADFQRTVIFCYMGFQYLL